MAEATEMTGGGSLTEPTEVTVVGTFWPLRLLVSVSMEAD